MVRILNGNIENRVLHMTESELRQEEAMKQLFIEHQIEYSAANQRNETIEMLMEAQSPPEAD